MKPRAPPNALHVLALAPWLMATTCLQSALEDPDVGATGPSLDTRFIPSSVKTDVQIGQDTWKLTAAQRLTSVGSSVDLWLRKDNDMLFAGVAPSCFGRSLTREDPPGSGREKSACYLASAEQEGRQVFLRAYVGGGWVQAMALNLDDVVADPDRDGWSNALELLLGTHPGTADSDGDGTPDPADRNPLVPDAPLPPGPTAARAVATALKDVVGCVQGKPMFVVAPPALKQAHVLPCQVLHVDAGTPLAEELLLLLPREGVMARGAHVVPEAARRGGINRVAVDASVDAQKRNATVLVRMLAGTSRRTYAWSGKEWTETGRDMTLAHDAATAVPPPRR